MNPFRFRESLLCLLFGGHIYGEPRELATLGIFYVQCHYCGKMKSVKK